MADRGAGKAPVHLASAFATAARLVLRQEAVSEKSNEITAIPALVERLAANGGLKGETVTICRRLQRNHRHRDHGRRRRLSAGREG